MIVTIARIGRIITRVIVAVSRASDLLSFRIISTDDNIFLFLDRDKRGSGNWRGSGGNSRLCKYFQKKGFCNLNGCRFYHPDK